MNHSNAVIAIDWDYLLMKATGLLPPPFGHLPCPSARLAADAADASPLPSLALPPAHLARAHDPLLLQRFWARLLHVVREPTWMVWIGEVRCVRVAGGLVMAFGPDGTVEPYGWVAHVDGSRSLEPLGDWTVVLQGSPYRQLWLQALARLAAWEVRHQAAGRGAVLSVQEALDYAQWAFQQLARLLVRHADLRQMRTRIARVLDFDPDAVAIAARLPKTTHSASLIVLGAYNRVQRHRAAFDNLQREAPNLVPIFGALCEAEGFPDHGQPTQRLRRHLVETAGLSPRCWRYLGKASGRVLLPLADYYRGPIEAAAVEHLRLLDQLGVCVQTPAALVRCVIGLLGDPGNRWESYCQDLHRHREIWTHLVRVLSRPGQSAAAQDMALVCRWIQRLPSTAILDGPQRAAGWPWLLRQAQLWADAERLEAQGRQPWSTWTEPVTIGRWELRPLNSALALWQEALAMRHCVDRYGAPCQSGRAMVFAVHEGQRHVATAMFRRTRSRWHLNQVKGFANAVVSDAMEAGLRRWAAGLVPSLEHEHEILDGLGGESADDELRPDEQAAVPLHTEADDAQAEEEDQVEQDRRLIADVIHMVHADSLQASDGPGLFSRTQALLERRNDEGNLNYRMGGRLVLNEQVGNWSQDVLTWLDQARALKAISARRHAALRQCQRPLEALLPTERNLLDEMFVEHILDCDEPDGDIYGIWGAEELRDESGRSIWAVYRITGYSFTTVQFALLSLCGHAEEVKTALDDLGRYSGTLPLQGTGSPRSAEGEVPA